jgi:hypothetical protein
VLETHDLKTAIRQTRDRILEDPKPFDASVLARYGLVLCNELRSRNGNEPVKQTFWLARYKGDPQWPDFMESYYGNHRALLVMFGWTRLLMSQGNNTQDLVTLVRKIQDPKELVKRFTEMTEPGERAYSKFTELPGAYALWPSSP